ncbi:hypothetical protein AGMMS49975_14190 [Clostridia bacterium]|nr:hypothetical protein AGMMS49975_14190 [Clostridia bacterium]
MLKTFKDTFIFVIFHISWAMFAYAAVIGFTKPSGNFFTYTLSVEAFVLVLIVALRQAYLEFHVLFS